MKLRKFKRIYIDIIIAGLVIVIVATFFTFRLYDISQKQVLNTLAEISNQSVNVIEKEIDKNLLTLINIAAYVGQEETLEPEKIIEKIKALNKINEFKRIGIVLSTGQSYTSDDTNLNLNKEQMKRFEKALVGEHTVTDTIKDLVDGQEVSVYITPIEFKDGTRCVLFGTYATMYYKEALSITTFNGLGYSYIIKENGNRIVDSSNPASIKFDNFYTEVGSISKNNKQVLDELKKTINKNKSGFLTYDRSDEQRYLYYQKLKINDWYLLSVIPASVVNNNINGMLFLAYVMLASCLLGIIYLITRIVIMYRSNQKRIEKIALVDEVTGSGSYARFRLESGDLLKNNNHNYAIGYFNILKFQYINDLYGYDEGNVILKRISEVLNAQLDSDEICARARADHFVGLFKYDNLKQLKARIEAVVKKMESAINDGASNYRINMTVGIYLVDNDSGQIESMVDRAAIVIRDENRHELEVCNFYNDMIRQSMIRTKELEDLFLQALDNHEFQVYYQPKYSVEKGKLHGGEALVRWYNQKMGWISPAEFIPVLERSSKIIELDEYVFNEVCKQIRTWIDQGIDVTSIAVNVSQLHLYRLDFVERYLKMIDRYHIPYDLIELEMTETSLFDNRDILKDILNQFRDLKITVSMDDFGSGYSSIMMLESMPIDCLKIDKIMIDDLETNEKAKEILKSVINLAQSLGLTVVGEGVETKFQYEELIAMNVDYVQGYYCAKPMPATSYIEILKAD